MNLPFGCIETKTRPCKDRAYLLNEAVITVTLFNNEMIKQLGERDVGEHNIWMKTDSYVTCKDAILPSQILPLRFGIHDC